MNCPACNAANPDDARKCQGCGQRLNRRPRRDAAEPNPIEVLARHPLAVAAFRVSVAALVPLVGAILGPLATVLGCLAYPGCRGDKEIEARARAVGAMWIGATTWASNWLGVYLMWVGWE